MEVQSIMCCRRTYETKSHMIKMTITIKYIKIYNIHFNIVLNNSQQIILLKYIF